MKTWNDYYKDLNWFDKLIMNITLQKKSCEKLHNSLKHQIDNIKEELKNEI